MIFDFEIKTFPIYGCMLGVNYWDSDMDEIDIYIEKQHVLQFMLLFAAVSFVWYSEKK